VENVIELTKNVIIEKGAALELTTPARICLDLEDLAFPSLQVNV